MPPASNPASKPIYVGDTKPVVMETDFKILLNQDRVRSFTTYAFVSTFGLTVLLSFVVVIFFGSAWGNAKELIQLMLPAETALIGSAVGFYFGSKAATSQAS